MSSGCTTAGSMLAQWVAAVRWSLLTQFFRLSGMRPGRCSRERKGSAMSRGCAQEPSGAQQRRARAAGSPQLGLPPSCSPPLMCGRGHLAAQRPPPPGPSSALSSLVAPTSARPMDFGEQQRPSPVYKHSQAFKRGVRKHTCESPQVTVSRHPERDARAGPRAKWGAALREPGADLHIRGMARCGPRQLGRPAARPREEAQVPPATLTCDGSPDFPGCLLPHLDGRLLAVPGRVGGADQVGCVLQRALAKATDGTEQVRVGWRVSDPAWNHTPPPRQTRRP